jgi:hypothetical protein
MALGRGIMDAAAGGGMPMPGAEGAQMPGAEPQMPGGGDIDGIVQGLIAQYGSAAVALEELAVQMEMAAAPPSEGDMAVLEMLQMLAQEEGTDPMGDVGAEPGMM